MTPKTVQHDICILIYCHIPRSRAYILKDVIKLDDSYNTFQRVAGKLLDYGWLDYTDKKSKNSPTQAYYTTYRNWKESFEVGWGLIEMAEDKVPEELFKLLFKEVGLK